MTERSVTIPPLPVSQSPVVPPIPASGSEMVPAAPMQFDRADYGQAPAGAQCASCTSAIDTEYYQVDGRVTCTACHASGVGNRSRGSSATRFLRALAAGLGAAIGGSALYYAVLAITGYEVGLISIAVGIAVGMAVRWGCYGRGGWRYQTLAISLTYLAIVSSYVPFVVEGIQEQGTEEVALVEQADGGVTVRAEGAANVDDGEAESPSLIVALAMLAGLLLALPFLAGLENLIGLAIIAFGLFEAWKINRRPALTISGPHAIGAAVPDTRASA